MALWSVDLLDACAPSNAATVCGPWRDLPPDLREPALLLESLAGSAPLVATLEAPDAPQQSRTIFGPHALAAGTSLCLRLLEVPTRTRLTLSQGVARPAWMAVRVALLTGELP